MMKPLRMLNEKIIWVFLYCFRREKNLKKILIKILIRILIRIIF